MKTSYQYKLRPKTEQSDLMDSWLNMMRSLYNWMLADRIDGYHQSFISGDYCDTRTKTERCPLTCSLSRSSMLHNPWKNPDKEGNIKKRSASLMQDAYLAEMKKARPWYKSIHSNVLQLLIKRLDAAMEGFFKHERGFPKFKNRSNFRSFQYKPGDVKVDGNKIYLPSIGWMRFYNSRPIPTGYEIRTVTVRTKADGWYVSILLEDKTIPDFIAPAPPNTLTGLDMGLTKLVHCSDGQQISNPRFATSKKAKRTLKIRQRRVERKKKGSNNRKKVGIKVARLYKQRVDKRTAYQWEVANLVVKKADGVAVEELNINGMKARCKPKKNDDGSHARNGQSAKCGLNRSISDASWGDLISKIKYTAEKQGKNFYQVNPKHTSQTCSHCGVVDAKSRFGERFVCVECGHQDHADLQAATMVKRRAIAEYSLTIKKNAPKPKKVSHCGLGVSPSKACGLKVQMVRVDCPEPKQLCLFETPIPESTGVKRKQHRTRKSERGVPGNPLTQLSLWDSAGCGYPHESHPF